jgi:hypothetical protein
LSFLIPARAGRQLSPRRIGLADSLGVAEPRGLIPRQVVFIGVQSSRGDGVGPLTDGQCVDALNFRDGFEGGEEHRIHN